MRRLPCPLLLLVTGYVHAQDVRITEFLASNVNSIRDEDGEAKPWLEIWNNAGIAEPADRSGQGRSSQAGC